MIIALYLLFKPLISALYSSGGITAVSCLLAEKVGETIENLSLALRVRVNERCELTMRVNDAS